MGYIAGDDRNQLEFDILNLDSMIGENNPVRVIDAFVDNLNIESLGVKRSKPAATGRPAYDPKDLLKLYIYSYFNKIRSSRKMMTECTRNIELFYLLGRLCPDFRTIADFRKDNPKAIENVFKAFVKICLDLNLYNKELIAIDGSKFRAHNGRKKMYNEEILKKKLENIEANVSKYLTELDRSDEEEVSQGGYTAEEIREKIKLLGERRELYEDYLNELKESGETQKLTTDPEARMMRTKDGFQICYNVQTAVDSGSHLIADYKVTNECNDVSLLYETASNAKEVLGSETIAVVADKGYENKQDIEQCLKNGIIPYVGFVNDKEERVIVLDYEPEKITGKDKSSTEPESIQKCLSAGVLPDCYKDSIIRIEIKKDGQISCFVRNENDTVTCPMGHIFTRVKTGRDGSAKYQSKIACRACTTRCTESKNHKVVKFGRDTKYVPVIMYDTTTTGLLKYPSTETPYNAFSRLTRRAGKKVIIRIKDDIPMQKLRFCISEHPFGTVKWYHGAHYLLCNGIEKATAELGLSFLAYNLRRAINMVGAGKLIEAIQG